MNKRQRKKNRTGEFVQYGFEVEATLVDRSAHDEVIWDAFIPFVEANHLLFGGGMGPAEPKLVFGFVTAEKGSCTEGDRVLIENWLCSHPKVSSVNVGPLKDVRR